MLPLETNVFTEFADFLTRRSVQLDWGTVGKRLKSLQLVGRI